MASVAMHQVCKTFAKTQTIRRVDLDIANGEFAVFVGPSGCGKSTLLRMIAGLEDITSGDLLIGGARVNTLPPSKRGVAMVFQSYALYPHMTVYENMAFGLSVAREDPGEIRTRVETAAKVLQLDPLLDRKPKDLSGGQRQRVAIGRAIVRKPQVFLFDEPLSNLDAGLRVQMRIEIAKLHEELKVTMIYVTHDQVEAMTLADKIVVLNRGGVEQVGPPLQLYHHPRNSFVAGFIGSPKMNFLSGTLASVASGGVEITLPGSGRFPIAVDADGAKVGDAVTLGIRPEHLAGPPDEASAIQGQVVAVERLGDETFAYVDVPGRTEGLVTVRLPPDRTVQAGQTLRLPVPREAAHLFNAEGLAFRRLVEPETALPAAKH